MNRDRMRTVVAIIVIASMVLLAAGTLGATLAEAAPVHATTRSSAP